jgi:two-component system, NtrC family, sensor kinase
MAKQAGTQSYLKLYLRFILLTLVCAVIPLLVAGLAVYYNYSEFSHKRMTEYFQRRGELNRRIIELFLKERTSDLSLVSYSYSVEDLKDQRKLQYVFDLLDREGAYFTDLGVIDAQGKHMAYVGPYDLMANDYSVTFWFKEVMKRRTSVFVSDMFMGYRKNPHFIMAVLRQEGEEKWILRATIQNEFLSSLLTNIKIGDTGEVYLVNREGFIQTNPRFGGNLMEDSLLPMERFTGDSGTLVWEPDRGNGDSHPPKKLIAYAWLKEPQWMLVVKQDYAEAFKEVDDVNRAALILLYVSLVMIVLISGVIAEYMIRIIKKRDETADSLNRQLMHTSRMASLGQLAAGVAHEINNPLAIILTENQVVRDLTEEASTVDTEFKNQLFESLSQIDAMVQRCNVITQNLLQSSRRAQAAARLVDLNVSLREVMDLMERQAIASGVELSADFQEDLPPILATPAELQQVFVNLIGNAIAAHDGKPYGSVRIVSRLDKNNKGIEIVVIDTGTGIASENLDRVFDPFFTTKPVGKGTGLGLSISYSIIRQLGGDIQARSESGNGSEFTVFLPFTSPNNDRK